MSSTKDASKRSTTTKEASKPSRQKEIAGRTDSKNPPAKKKTTSKDEELTKKTKGSKESTIHAKKSDKPQDNLKISKGKSIPMKTKSSSSSSPSSSRVSKSQYFPTKNLFSNALKSVEMQTKLRESSQTIKDVKTSAPKKSKKQHPIKDVPIIVMEKSKETKSCSDNVKISSARNNTLNHSSVNDVPVINLEKLKRTSEDSLYKNPASLRHKTSTSKISQEDSITSSPDRPRTATLRKGSIVNENIVGPEAPKKIKFISAAKISSPEPSSDENYDDDDFESYESDFEEASSSSSENIVNLTMVSGETSSSCSVLDISETKTDEPKDHNKRLSSAGTDSERKLDSGTFELLTDFKHRQILRYIEDTIKKDDAILEQEHTLKDRAANQASLSDEGFEDQKSLQFINFAGARKQCEKRRASAARKKRGEQLLSMIKLDAVSFTIFDLPSVPYDVYIKSYGQGNSVQASVQTGEDDISEETQTDIVDSCTKWTQFPGKFSSFQTEDVDFWHKYKCELKGSGDEIGSQQTIRIENEDRLEAFLKNSSHLILQLLSEQTMNYLNASTGSKNDLPFSNGYIKFNTTEELFIDTKVKNVFISIDKLLTLHLNTKMKEDGIQSFVCVWNLAELNYPRNILKSFGRVYCATFLEDDEKYVIGGQEDGSILVWNIEGHQRLYDIPSQIPTFVTPLGTSHFSKVISVQPLLEELSDDKRNSEICTLDETGVIVLWTLYTNSTNDIMLIISQVTNLQNIYKELPDLVCSDCILVDNHMYISSNYGFILHYLIRSHQNSNKKLFKPENQSDATCLEVCPFSPTYFVAGYSNGDIALFSQKTPRPLLVLQNKEQIDSDGVQMLQWSKTKPFLFYAKDSRNVIHIWDLAKSDMYPEYSIPFSQAISCMRLSPVLNRKRDEATCNAYMVVGTENGEVYLHLLRKEYSCESVERYEEEVRIFLDYANRL